MHSDAIAYKSISYNLKYIEPFADSSTDIFCYPTKVELDVIWQIEIDWEGMGMGSVCSWIHWTKQDNS